MLIASRTELMFWALTLFALGYIAGAAVGLP